MTPDTPGTPQEGGVDEAKLEQEAAEAKATEAAPESPVEDKPAKPKRKPAAKKKPAAEEQAAAAEEQPKPARKPSRSRKPAATPAPTRRRNREGSETVVVRAHARYVRSSARKARLVCDNIRGKPVTEARAILAFSPRHVAEAWTKLLESAVANAEHNHDLIGEDLRVHAAFADVGPTIKRFRPRAMGRATKINKRTSHLTIQLTPRK